MSLPLVTIKKIIHKKQEWNGLFFSYNDVLINIVKGLPRRHWSQSIKCWYIPNNDKDLALLNAQLQGFAKVKYEKSDFSARAIRKITIPTKNTQASLDLFTQYLIGQRYSKSTVNTYTSLIKDFMVYLEGKAVEEINTRDVELYCEDVLAGENYSISTHRQFMGALKKFKERFPETVFEIMEIKLPKNSYILPNVLSKQEVISLLRVTRNLKHRAALGMLYSCGLRIGELLRLELSDIDLTRRQVKVVQSKGRKDRYVVLAESMLPLLNNYFNSYGPVKYFIEGKPGIKYSPESVRQFLRRSGKAAGIVKRISPHTLRHSYATHLMENGIGQRYIQELLGHKSPKTTMIYTHIAQKSLTEVRSPLDDAVRQLMDDNKNNKNLPNKTLI